MGRTTQISIRTENAEYQVLCALLANRNKRIQLGEFVLEGVRNINQALAEGWIFRAVISAQNAALSDWAHEVIERAEAPIHYLLASHLMAKLSGKEQTSELMAVVAMRRDDAPSLALGDNPLIALFDRPSNKGNLGTLIRSCDALSVDALLVMGHAVDLYDPETIAATMGSFFKLPTACVASMDALTAWLTGMRTRYPDFTVVGTSAHAEHAIDEIDLSGPTLLLLGNETDGLSRRLSETCDVLACLPMNPDGCASSLNIACAATALFYEAGRQRRSSGESSVL